MSRPFQHFENWQNSCAIDSFLELAQYSFYEDLVGINRGEFLTQIYNVCRSREDMHRFGGVPQPLPRLREGPWGWLQQNGYSFAGRTPNASFEEILDYMGTTNGEKKLFTTTANMQFGCVTCQTHRVEEKNLFPLYISNDDSLATCIFDLEANINYILYNKRQRTKICNSCGTRTMELQSSDVVLPKYLFVRLPNMPMVKGAEPKVLSGIKVKEDITLNGRYKYALCGAIKGLNRHFSVTVRMCDTFYHIDDTSLAVKESSTFAQLNSQGDAQYYTTSSNDGYFIFLFKYIGDSSVLLGVDRHICTSTNEENELENVDITSCSSLNDCSHNNGSCSTDKFNTTGNIYQSGFLITNTYSVLEDELDCNENLEMDEPVTPHVSSSREKIMTSTPKTKRDRKKKQADVQTDDYFDPTLTKSSNETSKPQPSLSRIPLSDITNKVSSSNNQSADSVSGYQRQCESQIFPHLKTINGRHFIDIRYATAALSSDKAPIRPALIKERNKKYGIDHSVEMYPEALPQYMSIKAFLYHIFKNTNSLTFSQKIRTELFKVLAATYRDVEKPMLVEYELFCEHGAYFLRLEDFYSLCGFRAKDKRYRYLSRVAAKVGLNFQDEVLNSNVQSSTGSVRCSHVSLNLVSAYLFSVIGSDQKRKPTRHMLSAFQEIVSRLAVVENLPTLPIHIKNSEESKNVTSDTDPCSVNSHQESKSKGRRRSSECLHNDSDQSIGNLKTIKRRVKKQEEFFAKMSHKIHHGGKESFKTGLLYSAKKAIDALDKDESREGDVTGVGEDWNGSLSVSDLLDILDGIPSKSSENSVLQEYVRQKASEVFHMDARFLIDLVDNFNGRNIINQLRKALPDFFDTNKNVREELSRLKEEFNTILRPERTPSGYRVDPGRLLKCLRHLYYFLPKEHQLWKIWGDAREIGGKKSCCFAVSCINNELKLHNMKYHSPKEIWPICIFYGGDGRWNLESNMGRGAGQAGWLNDCISSEQSDFVQFFLSGDSMFLDALHGKHGEFAPNSKTAYNLYSCDDISTKHETGPKTGFRSELKKEITRSIPNSLLPAIPLERTVFCLDHATTRIVEKLVQLRVKSIVSSAQSLKQAQHRNDEILIRLAQFKKNMVDRMVHKAERLTLRADGSLAERLTLNKTDAHSLLLESTPHLSPLLEGVALHSLMFRVDECVQKELGWSHSVSEYTIETAMWSYLSKVIFKLRDSDPDPKLKPNKFDESMNVDDYLWGLQEDDIASCVKYLDIFHKLFVSRYGGDNLTPYMVKLIDFTAVFLKKLPVKSLMRFSTEGGEHLHYTDSCFYFQHTQRGGSYRTEDPLYSVLLHRYRTLQKRLVDYSNDEDEAKSRSGKAFLEFVEWEMLQSSLCKSPPSAEDNSIPSVSELEKSCIDQPTYNFILVGKVPAAVMKIMHCTTKEGFVKALESHQSRVIDSQPAQLPKCYEVLEMAVLTQQTLCDCERPPQTLSLACKRNWPILDYSFGPSYVNNPHVNKDHFMLDLTILSQRTSAQKIQFPKIGKDFFFKESGPLHPVTNFKKQLKKAKPATKKRKASVKLKRQGSGYARFVAQKTQAVLGTLPSEKSWKDVQKELSSRWKMLDPDEKKEFQSIAKSIFIQNRLSKPTKENKSIPAYMTRMSGDEL